MWRSSGVVLAVMVVAGVIANARAEDGTSTEDDLRPYASALLAKRHPDRYRSASAVYSAYAEEARTDMSTEAGIRLQASRIYPGDAEKREKWIADRVNELLDRQQGGSISLRVNH